MAGAERLHAEDGGVGEGQAERWAVPYRQAGKLNRSCETRRRQILDGIATQVEATGRILRGSGHGGVQEEGGRCG